MMNPKDFSKIEPWARNLLVQADKLSDTSFRIRNYKPLLSKEDKIKLSSNLYYSFATATVISAIKNNKRYICVALKGANSIFNRSKAIATAASRLVQALKGKQREKAKRWTLVFPIETPFVEYQQAIADLITENTEKNYEGRVWPFYHLVKSMNQYVDQLKTSPRIEEDIEQPTEVSV